MAFGERDWLAGLLAANAAREHPVPMPCGISPSDPHTAPWKCFSEPLAGRRDCAERHAQSPQPMSRIPAAEWAVEILASSGVAGDVSHPCLGRTVRPTWRVSYTVHRRAGERPEHLVCPNRERPLRKSKGSRRRRFIRHHLGFMRPSNAMQGKARLDGNGNLKQQAGTHAPRWDPSDQAIRAQTPGPSVSCDAGRRWAGAVAGCFSTWPSPPCPCFFCLFFPRFLRRNASSLTWRQCRARPGQVPVHSAQLAASGPKQSALSLSGASA
jgi:hypothetical protein